MDQSFFYKSYASCIGATGTLPEQNSFKTSRKINGPAQDSGDTRAADYHRRAA